MAKRRKLAKKIATMNNSANTTGGSIISIGGGTGCCGGSSGIATGTSINGSAIGYSYTPSTTSSGVIWSGQGAGTAGGTGGNIITTPSISYWPITVGGGQFTYTKAPYNIMKLPEEMKNKMPESVYVNGSLATLGMFGSEVDCAFTGKELIFQPNVLTAIRTGPILKVSVYYKKIIYHFKILNDGLNKKDTSYVETELLSTIKR